MESPRRAGVNSHPSTTIIILLYCVAKGNGLAELKKKTRAQVSDYDESINNTYRYNVAKTTGRAQKVQKLTRLLNGEFNFSDCSGAISPGAKGSHHTHFWYKTYSF